MSTAIDTTDIQRFVLHGLKSDGAAHYLLRVVAPGPARQFLSRMAKHVAGATVIPGAHSLALALTYSGLEALQLPASYLNAFAKYAPAFREGARARAASHLGDTGRNEVSFWDRQFRATANHVLLSIYADDPPLIRHEIARLTGADAVTTTGLSGWDEPIWARHLGKKRNRTEHFGFRDGISQPTIKGVHSGLDNLPMLHVSAGEFLLGYANEDGENLWASASLPTIVRRFIHNGSFAALRKMQQHKEEFAKQPVFLQAKMCGRWPNGAVFRVGQTEQPSAPEKGQINNFDFSDDPAGLGCPFGSHIRRINPRADRTVPMRRRLLLRRGMAYSKNKTVAGEELTEVGLLGVFICASLESQFEFLLRDWAREPPINPSHDSSAVDPIIGFAGIPAPAFRVPDPDRDVTVPLDAFVTAKGTLYAFYPSLTALDMMATVT